MVKKIAKRVMFAVGLGAVAVTFVLACHQGILLLMAVENRFGSFVSVLVLIFVLMSAGGFIYTEATKMMVGIDDRYASILGGTLNR